MNNQEQILQEFIQKLEALAWNEMLYYRPAYFAGAVEYKVVYTGSNQYIVRKYVHGNHFHTWMILPEKMKAMHVIGSLGDKLLVRDVCIELPLFKPQIVPIT